MSKIEWTGETWNPIVGCSIVSPGCTNCYAMKMAARILNITAGKALEKARMVRAGFIDYGTPEQRQDELQALRSHPSHYDGTIKYVNSKPVWTGRMALAPEHIITKPLRWSKPRTVFVNSMSDLFHEDVPDEWIDKVFAVMALTPQHTYQVLTKRSARMQAYIARADDEHGDFFERLADAAVAISDNPCAAHVDSIDWPLPNIWLGVSAERQQEADDRIPYLLNTPAAVRFVSAEPLLGPIDFDAVKYTHTAGFFGGALRWHHRGHCHVQEGLRYPSLDWVIVGGESGPGARPMHPDWARGIRDQCQAAGVPFFFKQWGEWSVSIDRDRDDPDWRLDYTHEYADARPSCWLNFDGGRGFHGSRFHVMRQIGKAKAGRLLDGREWNEMPSRSPAPSGRPPGGESEGAGKETEERQP